MHARRAPGGLTCARQRARTTSGTDTTLARVPGIDEAGRGPVLGPMVYGAAFCALSYKDRLAKAEYADSKALTEEKREALFARLKADDAMGWMVDAISAETLSVKMLRKCVRGRGRRRQTYQALKRALHDVRAGSATT